MLDTELIRRRRTELGLSQRALAARLGVSPPVVRGLEAGTNHGDLSLAHVARLAAALALDTSELFPSGEAARPAEEVGEDAAKVGALLHATGVLTPLAVLVDVLGWSRARLEVALVELEEQLRRCGLRLHRLESPVSVARDTAAADLPTIEAAVRRHLGRDNLNLTEARILGRLLGGAEPPREPTNAETVAMAVLVNAGLCKTAVPVTPTSSPPWVLDDDVRFSLLLDEAPGWHGGRPHTSGYDGDAPVSYAIPCLEQVGYAVRADPR